MKPAEDAVVLNSTGMGPEQVAEAMEAEFRRRVGGGS